MNVRADFWTEIPAQIHDPIANQYFSHVFYVVIGEFHIRPLEHEVASPYLILKHSHFGGRLAYNNISIVSSGHFIFHISRLSFGASGSSLPLNSIFQKKQ